MKQTYIAVSLLLDLPISKFAAESIEAATKEFNRILKGRTFRVELAPAPVAPVKKERFVTEGMKVAQAVAAAVKNADLPAAPAKAAGSVARVWEICQANAQLDRKALIALCIEAGINAGTAATQYAKWKKTQA